MLKPVLPLALAAAALMGCAHPQAPGPGYPPPGPPPPSAPNPGKVTPPPPPIEAIRPRIP
jgi:hypothetical protein